MTSFIDLGWCQQKPSATKYDKIEDSNLTQDEIAKFALRFGRIFKYQCAECSALIADGELFSVIKYRTRVPGSLAHLGQQPLLVQCGECPDEKQRKRDAGVTVKIKGAPRGTAKLAPEVANKLSINPAIRRAILNTLKKTAEPLSKEIMLSRLRGKKVVRESPKRELPATLRALKKLKEIRFRSGAYQPLTETAKKSAKKKSKKIARTAKR